MSRVTEGLVLRHAPSGPQGRYAAIIDIAQDVLLSELAEDGIFGHLVFKGGTALRKFYAGAQGRFSTDLDFSVRNPDDDPTTVGAMLREEIDGREIDGFRYSVVNHRGRDSITYETPVRGGSPLNAKLYIGPPSWLEPNHPA